MVIEEEWGISRPIYLVLAPICLTMQLALGIAGFIHFRKEPNIGWKLKLLFYISLSCSCVALTSFLLQHAVDSMMSNPEWTDNLKMVGGCSFMVFMMTLLSTLVLRLHLTFQSSIYRMSKKTKSSFIAMFIMMTLMTFLFLILGSLGTYSRFAFMLILFFIILFLIGSAMAVGLFVNNLRLLINTRSSSKYNVDITVDAIQLDQNQQKLSDLAARYLLLYTVATASTVVTWILLILMSRIAGIDVRLLIPVDWCINMLCVYLQFGFVSHHYKRLCGCADACCRTVISKQTRRSIRRFTMDSKMTPTESSVVSSSETVAGVATLTPTPSTAQTE